MHRILIAGATGRLGRPVALALARDGYSVRALVRDPSRCEDLRAAGIELHGGDVTDPMTLPAAMHGCYGLYISLRGQNTIESYERCEVRGVENLVAAASYAGIRHIAYLSGAGRSQGNQHHFPVRVKQVCEWTLQQGGIPYTILRATHFMESLPLFVRGNAAQILGQQPHRYRYLAADDYARMVARVFREPRTQNQTLTLFGPEPFTMREALEIYLARVHPGMAVRVAPLPVLRLVAKLTRNQDLSFATLLFAAFAALGEEGDPMLANALLGAPQITLREWSERFVTCEAA